jgi:hypothetical protein
VDSAEGGAQSHCRERGGGALSIIILVVDSELLLSVHVHA